MHLANGISCSLNVCLYSLALQTVPEYVKSFIVLIIDSLGSWTGDRTTGKNRYKDNDMDRYRKASMMKVGMRETGVG